MTDLGVRTWDNDPGGPVMMLTGTYRLDGEISRRLLETLPVLLVLRDDEWDCPIVPLLGDEIVKDEPGQEAVLDRLLDLLLIAVLRAWFSRPGAEAPAWYRAHGDPVLGRALRCCTTTRPTRGRWPRWPPRSASDARPWPAAVPRCSVSRR